MKRKNFRTRFEELPALGEFVETSFLRDKELFAAFSPLYANGFAENFHSKLLEVKEAATPKLVTGKRKMVTKDLHAAQDALLIITRDLRRYCQVAGDKLAFNGDDLSLNELNKSLRSRNSEASIRLAREMQQLLKSGSAVMEELGFTAERLAALNTLIDSMDNLNMEQDNLLNQRRKITDNNITLLNEFWALVQDIMKTGQIIHRNNPVEQVEYTEKHLMARVRLMIPKKPDEQTEKPPAEGEVIEAVKAEESVKKEETVSTP
jgi:hypothetical protein